METKNNSLLIYSGGLDSTTLLYEYESSIALCLSFDYGSKHNSREIQFARFHAKKLGKEHITIPLPFIEDLFTSDLLKSGGEIPEGHYEALLMKKTVVPFRNGIMLSIATGIANSRGLKQVMMANHFGDHAIYPDCRKAFADPMAEAIKAGTDGDVALFAPYTMLTKREIALRGQKFDIDYSMTWSCYKGEEKHCGKCGTCIERKEALQGFDPTNYSLIL